MSRVDPANFTQSTFSERHVCPTCFGDEDLKDMIRRDGNLGRCSYCDARRRKVLPLEEMAEFIEGRIRTFYGTAVDQLPYNSREGGYLGTQWDTEDLLFGEIGLAIDAPEHDQLMNDILDEIEDELWSEYDWLSLEYDDSMAFSWRDFRRVTMEERRFFFHSVGASDVSHPDERSTGMFLVELGELIEELDLLRNVNAGHSYFRVRGQTDPPFEPSAAALGPPPARVCLQSNRMNPPGIPMFYGAENGASAIEEARAESPVLGRFETNIPMTLVDIADLPRIPGFFSDAPRRRTQGLAFLHQLTREMAEPVEQNNRVNVDYIPTQIVTEFFRDHSFSGSRPHGIRYMSALGSDAANVVLFAGPENVADTDTPEDNTFWLRLVEFELPTSG